MLRLERQDLEDEQIERALRQAYPFFNHAATPPDASTGRYTVFCRSARGDVKVCKRKNFG